MGRIGFYIFYGINWLITLMPLKVLYLFSDLFFILLYYFPGYRKKIVRENLINAFPEKPSKERLTIEKKFYRHLADIFVETLKLTHMNNRQLMKRFRLVNPENIEKFYESGRDIAILVGHYNNWEWLVAISLYTHYKNVCIYKPLQNKNFDRFMFNLRSRNGIEMVPMSKIARSIIVNRKKNIRAMYAFLADQTPAKPDIRYWTRFLNQDTPVYLGPEKIAVKYDMPVVFLNVQKTGRGYYTVTSEILVENLSGLPEFTVTEIYTRRLEEIVCSKPEFWMWSHRRWKHKKPFINANDSSRDS